MTSIDEKADVKHHEIEIPFSNIEHKQAHSVQAHEPIGFFKVNPAPVGFGAFGLCSFILGLFNSGLITSLPQVAVGVALGYGAMGQFVCGICELIQGNMFAATSMLTFSGFFFTFGIMMIPSSGFLALAMESGGLHAVEQCMGLIQAGFAIAAFLFFLGTFRQPILIRLTLLQVFLGFLLGSIGAFTGSVATTQAGGWISFTLGLTAWYIVSLIVHTLYFFLAYTDYIYFFC
jgi:succinate-acetate transporter protein